MQDWLDKLTEKLTSVHWRPSRTLLQHSLGVLKRTMQNGSGSVQLGTSSIANTATLFDTLSIDALSTIVKQITLPLQNKMYMVELSRIGLCNSAPEVPNTSELIRTLAQLFSAISPFRTATATLVSQIKLYLSLPKTYINSSTRELNIGPEIFEGEARETELTSNTFSACGPYIRKIIVDNGWMGMGRANSKNLVEQFRSHVFEYCRNVEEVEFVSYKAPLTRWGIAASLFRDYAPSLRVIEWFGDEDESGFPDLEKCMITRRLKSCSLNTETIVSLLKACGLKLEHLEISIEPVGDSGQVLEAIRNYCDKLSVIDIKNLHNVMDIVGQGNYSTLLCSYGSQLRKARVDGLSRNDLVAVVQACTNLEVSLYLGSRADVDWRNLADLGSRVVCIHLSYSSIYPHPYFRALEQCSNIRILHLSGFEGIGRPAVTMDEIIADVFSPSRYPQLEVLHVNYFIADEHNMTSIASCTGNLKSAFFGPLASDFEVSAFQLVANSNSNLKEIKVLFHDSEGAGSALELLTELVEIFCKCRELSFDLSSWGEGQVKKEDLIRICRVLPCRDVEVYLQIREVRYKYPEWLLDFL